MEDSNLLPKTPLNTPAEDINYLINTEPVPENLEPTFYKFGRRLLSPNLGVGLTPFTTFVPILNSAPTIPSKVISENPVIPLAPSIPSSGGILSEHPTNSPNIPTPSSPVVDTPVPASSLPNINPSIPIVVRTPSIVVPSPIPINSPIIVNPTIPSGTPSESPLVNLDTPRIPINTTPPVVVVATTNPIPSPNTSTAVLPVVNPPVIATSPLVPPVIVTTPPSVPIVSTPSVPVSTAPVTPVVIIITPVVTPTTTSVPTSTIPVVVRIPVVTTPAPIIVSPVVAPTSPAVPVVSNPSVPIVNTQTPTTPIVVSHSINPTVPVLPGIPVITPIPVVTPPSVPTSPVTSIPTVGNPVLPPTQSPTVLVSPTTGLPVPTGPLITPPLSGPSVPVGVSTGPIITPQSSGVPIPPRVIVTPIVIPPVVPITTPIVKTPTGPVVPIITPQLPTGTLTPNKTTYRESDVARFTVTGNSSTSVLTKIELYRGTEVIYTTNLTSFVFSWTIPLGISSITAKFYDLVGGTFITDPFVINAEAFSVVPSIVISATRFNVFVGESTSIITSITDPTNQVLARSIEIDTDPSIVFLTDNYDLILTSGNKSINVTLTLRDGTTIISNSIIITVKELNIPPTVALTPNKTNPLLGEVVTFTVIIGNLNSAVKLVELLLGSKVIGTLTKGPYVFTYNKLLQGNNNLTARVTDSFNLVGISDLLVLFCDSINSAPHILITSSVSLPKAGDNLIIKCDVGDIDNNLSKVDLYYNNVFVSSRSAGPFSFVTEKLTGGLNSFYAIATDSKGASTKSNVINFTLAALTNPPTINIQGIVAQVSSGFPYLPFKVIATDIESDLIKISIKVVEVSTYTYLYESVPTASIINKVPTPRVAGFYHFQATAYDLAGNITTSQLVSFEVSNVISALVITTSEPDLVTPSTIYEFDYSYINKVESPSGFTIIDSFGNNIGLNYVDSSTRNYYLYASCIDVALKKVYLPIANFSALVTSFQLADSNSGLYSNILYFKVQPPFEVILIGAHSRNTLETIKFSYVLSPDIPISNVIFYTGGQGLNGTVINNSSPIPTTGFYINTDTKIITITPETLYRTNTYIYFYINNYSLNCPTIPIEIIDNRFLVTLVGGNFRSTGEDLIFNYTLDPDVPIANCFLDTNLYPEYSPTVVTSGQTSTDLFLIDEVAKTFTMKAGFLDPNINIFYFYINDYNLYAPDINITLFSPGFGVDILNGSNLQIQNDIQYAYHMDVVVPITSLVAITSDGTQYIVNPVGSSNPNSGLTYDPVAKTILSKGDLFSTLITSIYFNLNSGTLSNLNTFVIQDNRIYVILYGNASRDINQAGDFYASVILGTPITSLTLTTDKGFTLTGAIYTSDVYSSYSDSFYIQTYQNSMLIKAGELPADTTSVTFYFNGHSSKIIPISFTGTLTPTAPSFPFYLTSQFLYNEIEVSYFARNDYPPSPFTDLLVGILIPKSNLVRIAPAFQTTWISFEASRGTLLGIFNENINFISDFDFFEATLLVNGQNRLMHLYRLKNQIGTDSQINITLKFL